MKHSLRTKWLLTLAIIILPIGLVWGYLAITNQTSLIQNNWKVTKALITLASRPNDLSATITAGEGLYGLKKYQRAAEYYLTATTLSPKADLAWNSLGNTYRELSLYQEAVNAYQQAIGLKPDTPVYYLNLADLYKRLPTMSGSRDTLIRTTLEDGLKATNNSKVLLNAIIDYYQQLGDERNITKYQKLLEPPAK